MSYIINFDETTGSYAARSISQPLVSANGRSLFAAIDNLEARLEEHPKSSTLNLVLQEKAKEKLEVGSQFLVNV